MVNIYFTVNIRENMVYLYLMYLCFFFQCSVLYLLIVLLIVSIPIKIDLCTKPSLIHFNLRNLNI